MPKEYNFKDKQEIKKLLETGIESQLFKDLSKYWDNIRRVEIRASDDNLLKYIKIVFFNNNILEIDDVKREFSLRNSFFNNKDYFKDTFDILDLLIKYNYKLNQLILTSTVNDLEFDESHIDKILQIYNNFFDSEFKIKFERKIENIIYDDYFKFEFDNIDHNNPCLFLGNASLSKIDISIEKNNRYYIFELNNNYFKKHKELFLKLAEKILPGREQILLKKLEKYNFKKIKLDMYYDELYQTNTLYLHLSKLDFNNDYISYRYYNPEDITDENIRNITDFITDYYKNEISLIFYDYDEYNNAIQIRYKHGLENKVIFSDVNYKNFETKALLFEKIVKTGFEPIIGFC